jgi:hypothetical protein
MFGRRPQPALSILSGHAVIRDYALVAICIRSSQSKVNRFSAAFQCSGLSHLLITFLSVRYITLSAASSLGKATLVFSALRSDIFSDSRSGNIAEGSQLSSYPRCLSQESTPFHPLRYLSLSFL